VVRPGSGFAIPGKPLRVWLGVMTPGWPLVLWSRSRGQRTITIVLRYQRGCIKATCFRSELLTIHWFSRTLVSCLKDPDGRFLGSFI
jgi:hypothetical protein